MFQALDQEEMFRIEELTVEQGVEPKQPFVPVD
jgi:hypothetical protein